MLMDFSFYAIKETFLSSFNAYQEYFFFMLKNPSFKNPFYIILSVYLLTFLLEVFLPKKENYPLLKRKGFKTDLIYLVFIDFGLSVIGFYAITKVVEYLFVSLIGYFGFTLPLVDVTSIPFFFQILLFLILVDFVQFIAHYLLHRFDFLWKFHKIHHAQEQLGFASTRHFHWFEYVVFKPLLFIPFSMLGYGAQEYVIYYLWFGYFFAFLSHCNIKVNWGILNYILINPDTHYWHHAKNTPGRFGVNFASVFNFWDLMFNTFYLPKNHKEKPQLGVHEQKEIPGNFLGQMAHPFKSVIKASKFKNQEIKPGKTFSQSNAISSETGEKMPKEWKKKRR